jgi:hypothetical protein
MAIVTKPNLEVVIHVEARIDNQTVANIEVKHSIGSSEVEATRKNLEAMMQALATGLDSAITKTMKAQDNEVELPS